jgi:DNA-binding transcriptional MerR regulator
MVRAEATSASRAIGRSSPVPRSVARVQSRAAGAAGYRMRDLCQLSGLERQTIHFYIQEGLLPEGKKTGRNMAYYSEEHLERLRLIKQLQQERFLPLRAIRAILGGKSGGFSREQRELISDVKQRLLGAPRGRALVGGSTELVTIKELADTHGVGLRDVEELIELGLLSAEAPLPGNGSSASSASSGKSRRVRREDGWLVAAWAELSRAGLSRDRGFSPRDMMIVDEAITQLFEKERELFFDRVAHLGPDEIAGLLERALPILADFVARMHTHKARDLFALAADDAPGSHRKNPS